MSLIGAYTKAVYLSCIPRVNEKFSASIFTNSVYIVVALIVCFAVLLFYLRGIAFSVFGKNLGIKDPKDYGIASGVTVVLFNVGTDAITFCSDAFAVNG